MEGFLAGVLDPDTLNGVMNGAANLPLNTSSIKYENARQVKTGTGLLFGFGVYSSAAAAQFIQVFDVQTAPATGAVPVWIGTVGAAGNLNVIWIPGRAFRYGCWLVNSSTGPTYTAGAADTWFDAQFV